MLFSLMDNMYRSLLFTMVTSASANMEALIVKGQKASIVDWPFIAFIASIGEMNGACGGSLISSQTVLTAAHCVDDVLQGDKKQFYKFDFLVFMGHRLPMKAKMTRRVFDYQSHEKYNFQLTQYDISVMFLSHRVTFLDTVKKVILTQPNDFAPRKKHRDRIFEIAGWGAVSVDPLDPLNEEERTLMRIGQVMYTDKKCRAMMKAYLSPGIICAGYKLRAQSHVYSGDSGGPLIRKSDKRQVGVVSTRVLPEGITVYSSIPYYYSWIEKTQKDLFNKNC